MRVVFRMIGYILILCIIFAESLAVHINQGYEPSWYINFNRYEGNQITRDQFEGKIEQLRGIQTHDQSPCITFETPLDIIDIGIHQFIYMKPYVEVVQPQISSWIFFHEPGCPEDSEFDQESYIATKIYNAEHVSTSWQLRGRTAAGIIDNIQDVKSIAPVFTNNDNIGGNFIGTSQSEEYTALNSPAWKFLPDTVAIIFNNFQVGTEGYRLELSYEALRFSHEHNQANAGQCVPINPNNGIRAIVTSEYHQVLEMERNEYNEREYKWHIDDIEIYNNEICNGIPIKTYSWYSTNEAEGLSTNYNTDAEEKQWILEREKGGAMGVRGIKFGWVNHYPDDDYFENGDHTPTRFTGTSSQNSPDSSILDRDHIFNINTEDVFLKGEEIVFVLRHDDERVDERDQGYSITQVDTWGDDPGPKKLLKTKTIS